MRLTAEQQSAIRRAAAEVFGDQAEVWLFGSRVDDSRRGGDIDLLVRPASAGAAGGFMQRVRFRRRLEQLLGERKVDVVVEEPHDPRPIVHIARETGARL